MIVSSYSFPLTNVLDVFAQSASTVCNPYDTSHHALFGVMFSDVHVFLRPCFRKHQTGVAFCRELSRCSGRLGIASCRLLDNRQLRLGKAMKGDEVRQGTYAYLPLWLTR